MADKPAGAADASSGSGRASSLMAGRSPRAGRPKADPSTFADGTALVLEVLNRTYPEPSPDQRVSANRLMTVIASSRGMEPRAALVTTASGGGRSPARVGAINWHLDQLEAIGILRKLGRHYHLTCSALDNPLFNTQTPPTVSTEDSV